ncbi:MAG TPA: hypothetical protein VKC34_11380 [Blastocatellia bacterium]|nr:hypothetical protein [Blastocatellia bacterium]
MQLRRVVSQVVIILLMAASSALAFTQDNKAADPVSGKYEGVAKSSEIGDLPLSADIKNDGGKLSGKIETPQGPITITSGTYTDGAITMKADLGGNELTLTARLKDGKMMGEWELGGQKGTFEMTRKDMAATAPAGPATAPAAPAATAADPITGEWNGTAEVQGSSLPLLLRLKLDGETVTGEAESPQGKVPVTKGSFVANKLSITLNSEMGPIVITGMLKDGKLAGDLDVASQVQGKWEAKRK